MKTPIETAKNLLTLSKNGTAFLRGKNCDLIIANTELTALATAYLERLQMPNTKSNAVNDIWPEPLKLTDHETKLVQAFRAETESKD